MTGNTRTLHVIFDFHTLEKEKNLPKRKIKKKEIRYKTASSPEQDLYPDWDALSTELRGTRHQWKVNF